jgi:hypothetical protein
VGSVVPIRDRCSLQLVESSLVWGLGSPPPLTLRPSRLPKASSVGPWLLRP